MAETKLIAGGVDATIFNSDTIDQKTKDQFTDCLKSGYVDKAALMADGHLGYTAPIGSVLASRNWIVPAWVGYDIGCGVYLVRTTFDPDKLYKNREDVLQNIIDLVPMGYQHTKHEQTWPVYKNMQTSAWFKENFEKRGGLKQLRTLGGGNHFIEIGADHATETVCMVIHSGSRGIGHDTASHYMKIACGEDKAREGNFPLGVKFPMGKEYIMDMKACVEFAAANRRKLSYAVAIAVNEVLGEGHVSPGYAIDTVHNTATYSARRGMWVHRKGAVECQNGTLCVLPANMRDGTFIIKGKGLRDDSLDSAPHGGGRAMSRTKAKKEITLDVMKEDMNGIVCTISKGTVEEAPRAYKDIQGVIDASEGIFRIVNHIQPLIVAKHEKKGKKDAKASK